MTRSPERRSGRSQQLAAALAVALVLALGGCAKTRHLDAAEFLATANAPGGDLYHVRFVGVREGRAWLREWRYWPLVGEHTTMLWTEADGLAPEVRRELEAKGIEYERWIAAERRRNLGG
jgi:hypothetical protein